MIGSPTSVPLHEVQGIILRGYESLQGGVFVLLEIGELAPAREWLKSLVPEIRTAEEKPYDFAVNIAFTFPGLRKLGLHSEANVNFSREFQEGMDADHRNRVLGDTGSLEPRSWVWGNRESAPQEHVLLMLYAATDEAVQPFHERHRERYIAAGLKELMVFDPRHLPGRTEHFGFRDGISQPDIEGVVKVNPNSEVVNTTGEPGIQKLVRTGEFLLGYPNSYDKLPPSPTVPRDCAKSYDFGRNGSYLVIRQVSQDVREFWRFVKSLVPEGIANDARDTEAIRIASKMVGRWPGGAPLAADRGDDPALKDDNDFGYGETDPLGLKTPIGSHIRRTHPRDSIEPGPTGQERISPADSLDVSKLHRIIRRGRPYGDPLCPSMNPRDMLNAPEKEKDNDRGLLFVCFNANIARQFEFIQQTWMNNPKFGGLYDDSDPVTGQREPVGLPRKADVFTEQALPVRRRYEGLPQFVHVRGGGYFFMPGIESLKYLAGLPFNLETVIPVVPVDKAYPALETIPPDEETYALKLTEMLRQKVMRDYPTGVTRRDAHAKHHGVVRAEFTVEKDLPPELAVGVFKKPRMLPAWIRFSNQEGVPQPDIEKDIRGMAIKLLGVEGEKILEGQCQEQTHDFLLISTPVFVTKDVREFHDLIAALISGKLSLLWYFLNPFNSHLRVMRNLRSSMIQHSNPLEIRYFSTTPYRLGRGAVKYSARPSISRQSPIPDHPSQDFLREAMVKTLAEGEVSFDFLVQLQLDREEMPIEDPGRAWDEGRSPYRKVATIRIPKQQFDSEEQMTFAENLSFTPWHALPDHQPLGGINRARKIAYEIISKFRHERNGVPRKEPTLEEWYAATGKEGI